MSDLSSAPSDESGAPQPELLAAGDLRLDPHNRQVWRGGEPVRLVGKAFDLLERLMRNPQTLVTKDALFDSVWSGLAVSESVLTTAVKEVRQALGDNARKPTIIETVHGRGYRFLLPPGDASRSTEPEPEPEPPAQPPHSASAAPVPELRRRWGPLAGLAALVAIALLALGWWAVGQTVGPFPLPHPKSVAVLPFQDLSPGHQDQWFADGLTEEVLSTLARTADLRVAARLPAGEDPAAAARTQRVGHVLTGTVRRAGGRVRVTADLVRASDGAHVWSQSYDRSSGDVISIQEDVGTHIAQALKTATDPAKLRAMAASGTHSVEAYEAYLRGLALSRRQLDEGDLTYARQAAESFELARKLDPAFAEANWRAARNWFGNVTRIDAVGPSEGPSEAERTALFFERVDAAIASSQDATESLKYRAARAEMQLQLRQARALMERYLHARPRDIDAWDQLAGLSAYVGDRRGVTRAARRIEKLSIEAGAPRSRAITLLVMSLRYDEAADLAERMLRMQPDSALILYQGHRAAVSAGRLGEARDYLQRLTASALPERNKQLAVLRQACAEGRTEDARRIYPGLAASDRMTTRFHAAQLIGDEAAAVRALAPLDVPGRLPTLVQFMTYPTFDGRAFPVLRARLAADGITPPRPVAMPHGCHLPPLRTRASPAGSGTGPARLPGR